MFFCGNWPSVLQMTVIESTQMLILRPLRRVAISRLVLLGPLSDPQRGTHNIIEIAQNFWPTQNVVGKTSIQCFWMYFHSLGFISGLGLVQKSPGVVTKITFKLH
jgi:hypothetical protein